MSVYSVTGKGWRYDFTHKGVRHTEAWFKTKKEALRAEAQKREEVLNPPVVAEATTDMGFFELVNCRLDHVKDRNSELHYKDTLYLARHWVKQWGNLNCDQVTPQMIDKWILKRAKVSPVTANKEIRHLRALFNFGKKKKLIGSDPTKEIEFLPTEKRLKYVPPTEDIDSVISVADEDTQDYLWVIRETLARVSEINRLTWDDVDFTNRLVALYTRKKKGGHLTSRKVPMTETLLQLLSRRHTDRDPSLPWVFWHKQKRQLFQNRNKLMGRLCKKAGVRPFGFHALRHAGASLMDMNNVPIGVIQRLLGHENRTTTEIYLHTMGQAERQAIEAYEQARRKSLT